MQTLTPVIFVEEIEPCLPFWERLGFRRTIEVPHDDRLGFTELARGEARIMYQSRASLEEDLPALAEGAFERGAGALYVKVESLDDVKARLGDAETVVPERTTFYGAREIFVRAPCGTVVGFAEFPDEEASAAAS